MKKTKKNWNGQQMNWLKMFFITTLAAALITAILLFILAVLLEKLGMNEKQVQIGIYAIYLVSAIGAGMIAGKWKREKKFMWGALSGAIWLALIMIISICMNGSGIDTKGLFPAMVCMVGGGMLGGMLA
jgi:putative membrane protein (TIGR04086 family)